MDFLVLNGTGSTDVLKLVSPAFTRWFSFVKVPWNVS